MTIVPFFFTYFLTGEFVLEEAAAPSKRRKLNATPSSDMQPSSSKESTVRSDENFISPASSEKESPDKPDITGAADKDKQDTTLKPITPQTTDKMDTTRTIVPGADTPPSSPSPEKKEQQSNETIASPSPPPTPMQPDHFPATDELKEKNMERLILKRIEQNLHVILEFFERSEAAGTAVATQSTPTGSAATSIGSANFSQKQLSPPSPPTALQQQLTPSPQTSSSSPQASTSSPHSSSPSSSEPVIKTN